MDWIGLTAAVLGAVVGYAVGIWTTGRPSRRPPPLSFYPRQQTGVALRRRLFK